MTDFGDGRDEHGRFVKGNQISKKHGASIALKKLERGEPFDGLALETYKGVLTDLDINLDNLSGIERVRTIRAARFETVARLFDGAAQGAAACGDLERWELYQRRSGWIGSKGFSALGEVDEFVNKGGVDYEQILAQQRQKDNTQEVTDDE